jgi:hypothetical protein
LLAYFNVCRITATTAPRDRYFADAAGPAKQQPLEQASSALMDRSRSRRLSPQLSSING